MVERKLGIKPHYSMVLETVSMDGLHRGRCIGNSSSMAPNIHSKKPVVNFPYAVQRSIGANSLEKLEKRGTGKRGVWRKLTPILTPSVSTG